MLTNPQLFQKIRLIDSGHIEQSRKFIPQKNAVYTIKSIEFTFVTLWEDPHGYTWSIKRFVRAAKERNLPSWF